MGSLCCSEKKSCVIGTQEECSPEQASSRYSSLNPSRRCSFILETPRSSTSDNAAFAKSNVPGSPLESYKRPLANQGYKNADHNSQAVGLECTNPLFTPLLNKFLQPGGKQDFDYSPRFEGGDSESVSSHRSPSTTASSMRCSLDVEVMSSGRPSWYEQRSSDHIRNRDLLEQNDTRSESAVWGT